jgi:hypothetical protein
LANEWVESFVKEYDDKNKQESIRKNFLVYEIDYFAKKETMETLNVKLQAQLYATTCCIF